MWWYAHKRLLRYDCSPLHWIAGCVSYNMMNIIFFNQIFIILSGPPKVVRLGDLDLTTSDDGSVHVDYDIENIIRHPDYKYPQRYNDIALLKTKKQVDFTKFIRPACLYFESEISHINATAMGWGKTEYTAAETNNKLLKVPLEVYDNQYCHQTYKIDYKLPDGIKSTMLCAGQSKGGRDTCQVMNEKF